MASCTEEQSFPEASKRNKKKPLPVVSNTAFKRHNGTERSQSKTKVDHHHCSHGTTCRFSYSQRVTHLPPINLVISLRLNPEQRAKQHKVIKIQLLGST